MTVRCTLINPITELIEKIELKDVDKVLEHKDYYHFLSDRGMTIKNQITIIGMTQTMIIYKQDIAKFSITN